MLAVRLYRLLLWAYPSELRLSHGDEMTLAVAERWQRRPGLVARVGLIGEILADFAQSLPRAWGFGRQSKTRDRRPGGSSGGWLTDLRQAIRALAHAPLFTLGAGVTLALGIGASTAIFSLAETTLLHPLPIRDADRVVQVSWSWSHPDLRELEQRSQVFSGLAAWSNFDAGLEREGRTLSIPTAAINGHYFDTLGVSALQGRLIRADDDRLEAAPVAVMSEALWRRLYGADPAVVGTTLRLSRGAVTVVGIVPAAFRGLALTESADLFVPLRSLPQIGTGFLGRPNVLDRTNVVWIQIAARLRDGLTDAQAPADIDGIYRALHPPKPGEPPELSTVAPVTARALGLDSTADLRRFVFVLTGAALVTLLLSCATVANLLLVRGEGRAREWAIRAALGAGRARTVRLLLTESLLLGLGGAIAGVGVAWATLALLSTFDLPGRVPIEHLNLTIDGRLLAGAIGLGVITSLVFGAAPIWQSSRLNLTATLREGSRGTARQPLRTALVTLQVALAVLLLGGSLAFARAVRHAISIDLGFDTSHTAIVSVDTSLAGYKGERVSLFQTQVVEALSGRPEVAAAGWSAMKPLRGRMQWQIGAPEGSATPNAKSDVDTNVVSAGYFEAMQIPVLRGRAFTRADESGTEVVAVLSASLAKKLWPDREAVGLRIFGNPGDTTAWTRVIGVVGDVKYSVTGPPLPKMYVLSAQKLDMADFGGQHLIVRATGRADVAAREAAAILATVDGRVPVTESQTMGEHLEGVLKPQRLGLTLFSLFGGLAIVLTALGLYALVAYAVAHRTKEIGLRLALGADARGVVLFVVRQGVWPIAAGLVLGVLALQLSGWAIAKFLFAVPLMAPGPLGVMVGAIALVAGVAMLAPARRALAVDPVAALRND